MPGFNRKGHEGEGNRKGRGLGRCNPDFNNQDDVTTADEFSGRGGGRGRGAGRRFRFGGGRGRGQGSGRGKA